MINKFKCYKIVILLLIVNTLISCSQKVLLYKGKTLQPDKIAIISGDDGLLEVQEIDKKQQLIMLRPGVEIHLLPGFHRIKINVRPFQDPTGRIIYSKHYKIIEFNAIAGYNYKIKYLGEGDWNNGGTWSAQLSCICPNGSNCQKSVTAKSEITYKDGTEYIGETSNGIPNGYGKFIWPDGDKYEGHIKDGKSEGNGTYWKKNGIKFQGIFKNGQLNGDGILIYPDGLSYEGNFKNGIPHGHGTMLYTNGTKFIGEFNNGGKIKGKFNLPDKTNVNDYLKDGFTAFLIACYMGDIKLVEELINIGADINIPNKIDKYSPLSRCIGNDHTDIAKFLIKKGANINQRTKEQETPLMIAVRKKNYEVAKAILDTNVDINAKRKDGNTALFLAVLNKDKDMVVLLIKNGADVTIRNNFGKSPLSIATDNTEIFQLIHSNDGSVSLLEDLKKAIKLLPPIKKDK
ncbi:hypothetical protein MHK_007119 [Candidatus Magnetomorum sp. HK-1]|nr:hypothetical protein MHK_007119 [Candidatus Magnetomorum sp. HK-1]